MNTIGLVRDAKTMNANLISPSYIFILHILLNLYLQEMMKAYILEKIKKKRVVLGDTNYIKSNIYALCNVYGEEEEEE